MGRIVNLTELNKVFTKENKARIILAGGCFDILHIGHVRFLSEAKKLGDYLVVLLESNKKVKRLKGETRPIFTQKERAEMLSALRSVDLVVLLPTMENDGDYSNVIMKIKPDIIAVTEHDPLLEKKREQARKVGGKLEVIPFTKTLSTSALIQILGVD
jgi:rfaE bifunctional protein nucleotidyltransferase chain/domain